MAEELEIMENLYFGMARKPAGNIPKTEGLTAFVNFNYDISNLPPEFNVGQIIRIKLISPSKKARRPVSKEIRINRLILLKKQKHQNNKWQKN